LVKDIRMNTLLYRSAGFVVVPRCIAWQDRTIYCIRRCLCPRAGLPTAGDAIALRTPIAP